MTGKLNSKHCVLLVDDDDILPLSIITFAERWNSPLEFEHARDVGEAVERLNQHCFDAAVLDVRLPGVTGVSLGALVRERDIDIPLAYLTNLDTETIRAEAVAQRAVFLSKLQFVGSDDGIHELLTIIERMAQLNPCLRDGVRVNNHGYARVLTRTPLQLPDNLSNLLRYSKSQAVRAA